MRTSGLFRHPLFNRHFFVTPAVRHLAWLVHSRPLLTLDNGRDAVPAWPGDVDDALLELDRNPQPLMDRLARRPSNRLGLYFEELYGYALTDLLGQRILAQNLPVRLNGRTLGELDFLVHDRASDRIVHHEIAVKFYMGWGGPTTPDNPRLPGWYGPDTRDQLCSKLQRLREHQIPLWQSDAGRQCLRDLGLAQPQASHIGLYGYLFRHRDGAMPSLPASIVAPEPGISWRRAHEAAPEDDPETLTRVLRKPHWLGPLQCPEQTLPEPEGEARALAEARQRPLLLATLRRTERGFWLESRREFLTPEHWCQAEQANGI